MNAILFSSTVAAIGIIVNYVIPKEAISILMSLVVSSIVINWAMISLSHLKFRAAKNKEGVTTKFKAIWSPFSNYLCLLFLAGVLVIMYMTPGIRISVQLIPVWLLILGIGYGITRKTVH